jgi:hypothetical protein
MRRLVVLGLACMCGTTLAGSALVGSARAFASRGDCGPALCMAAPRGWSTSVGPGCCPPAAWLLEGNFWFAADAAGHEGNPSVPRGKVLIAFSDFPVSAYTRWRRVAHLHLPPRHATTKRLIAWHVRFAGRAVYIHVRFGSRPSAQSWRVANARLEAIHRKAR